MNKKGSMELSVNAIVILVIAVVMLGLILGFIRSKFSNISRNIDMDEMAPLPATGSEPLTVSRSLLVLSPGETTVLRLSYYESTSIGANYFSYIECSPITGAPAGKGSPKLSVPDTPVEYSLKITAGKVRDLYLCTIYLRDSVPPMTPIAVSKDITIKVV